jgi:hypothetical protein
VEHAQAFRDAVSTPFDNESGARGWPLVIPGKWKESIAMSDVNRGRSVFPDAVTPLLASERLHGGVRAVAGIFVGVCVVSIAAILTLSAARADRALLDAIELFAGAIPLLVTAFLLSFWRRTMILGLVFFAGGALATIGGIARALAYVDTTASAIFLISLVACFFVVFVVDTLTRFTYRAADHPQS